MSDDISISSIFDRYAPTIRSAALASRKLIDETETYATRHRQEWIDRHRLSGNEAAEEMDEKMLPLRLVLDQLNQAMRFLEMGEHVLTRLDK